MGEGFKVGSAFIDVDADATAAVAKMRRQLSQAKGPLSKTADEIGDEFGRRLGSRIEKHLKATKGRISAIGGDIGDTAGSRIVSGMDKQLRGAKGRLGQTAEGLGQTVASRVSTSMSKTLNSKLDSTLEAKAKQTGGQLGKALGDGVDEGGSTTITRSPKIKKALDSVAERAQAQFQGLVFAGAFAGMPAAAAVAATATVGALAIIPIALVAGAAKLRASNDQVAQSYQQLGNTATSVMNESASVLDEGLVKGTTKLTQGMLRLQPALTGAFRGAAPAIDGVVDSVITLTDEALPGMMTGLTQTKTIMTGIESLAKGVGRGVSDFFANVSTGSQSAAVNSATLGRALQDLLGFAGQLIANISNGGTSVLPMFANALSGIYNVVLNLTSGGFSPLMAAAGGFITVVSGAVGVLDAISGSLGGMLSPLAAVAGGILAINLMSRGALVSSFAAQFSGLGTAIGSAAGAGAKFKTLMAGIGSAVFSPAGIAIAGLVVGLGLLGMAQQKAAAEAAEHKARIQDLAGALRESNGVINENVRGLAAKALSEIKVGQAGRSLLAVARDQGVSLSDLTSAYLGNSDAQKRVGDQMRKYGDDLMVATDGGAHMSDQQKVQILEADALKRSVEGANTEYGKAVQTNRDLAAATATAAESFRKTTPAMADAAAGSGALRAAWSTMYSTLSSVTDRASSLVAIFDRLNGRVPSYEEAIQSSNDTLRDMRDALGSAEFAANGFGQELINSDGTVSTWTKNGSDLQNRLVTLQGGFATAAASVHDLVKGGMDYNVAAQQVSATLQIQRDEFVRIATVMLGSADAANALADKYGLLPKEAVTNVTDYGSAVATQADVNALTDKLKGMPADTPVRVTSLTAEAEAKLVAMNYTVTHMDDGTVLVFANTSSAEAGVGRVQSGVNALTDKTININIRTNYTTTGTPTAVRGEATAQFNATGGYQFPSSRFGGKGVRRRETGGTLSSLPGMAGAAWTGERGPELSFPDKTSYIATNQQSLALQRRARSGEVALERNVNISSPNPAVAPNITLTINVYPPPSMDTDALVAKVARETEKLLKGGS